MLSIKFASVVENLGLNLSINEITAKMIIRERAATSFWSAPSANPIAIAKNMYASSSGSFIGVLKRTMESAPTNPRDKAKDDLTTEMTKKGS